MAKRPKAGNIIRPTAWIILGLLLTAYLYFAFTVSAAQGQLVRELFYDPLDAVTVLILLFAAVRFRRQDEGVWIWLALAGVSWALADLYAIFNAVTGVAGAERLLAPPDAFYLLAYVGLILAVAALARLIDRPAGRADWSRRYPLIVSVAVALLTGLFAWLMPRGIAATGGAAPVTLPMIVDYLYPALDLCVIGGLLVILFLHRLPFQKPWHEMAVIGLIMFMVADLNYSLTAPAGIYSPANVPSRFIIALWIAAYALLLLAAVYRLTDAKNRPTAPVPYVYNRP